MNEEELAVGSGRHVFPGAEIRLGGEVCSRAGSREGGVGTQ